MLDSAVENKEIEKTSPPTPENVFAAIQGIRALAQTMEVENPQEEFSFGEFIRIGYEKLTPRLERTPPPLQKAVKMPLEFLENSLGQEITKRLYNLDTLKKDGKLLWKDAINQFVSFQPWPTTYQLTPQLKEKIQKIVDEVLAEKVH